MRRALASLLGLVVGAGPLAMAGAAPADVVEALIRQLRADVVEMRECRPARGLPVELRELDLANDGRPAYLLTSIAECECGQVNCSRWIYRRTAAGFTKVLETEGYRLSLGTARHHGWSDVEVEVRDSAASVDHRRYAFDGTSYRPSADVGETVRSGAGPEPRRVQFAKGGSSALLAGQARFGVGDGWIFGARAGQTLHLALLPGSAGAVLTLVSPTAGLVTNRLARWDGVLPLTGEYRIEVEAEGAGSVAYRLQLGIDAAPRSSASGTVEPTRWSRSGSLP